LAKSLSLNLVGPSGKKLTQFAVGEGSFPQGLQPITIADDVERLVAEGSYFGGSYFEAFEPIKPGEIKRLTVFDVRNYVHELGRIASGYTGKFTLDCSFRSPKIPARFEAGRSSDGPIYHYPKAVQVTGQWAGEIKSLPVSFEIKPLGADDF